MISFLDYIRSERERYAALLDALEAGGMLCDAMADKDRERHEGGVSEAAAAGPPEEPHAE